MDGRQIRRGVLGFVLAYALFLALWPLVRPLYAPLFRAGAEFVLGVVDPFDGEIVVRFDPGGGGALAEDMPRMDTIVRLQHQRLPGSEGHAGASSFFHGYHPTAVLLALFAGATPLPWRRRLRRLAPALVLVYAFVALRCLVGVVYTYSCSNIEGRPALELSPAAARALFWCWHFLWEEPLSTYLVPLLAWGLCVFTVRSPAPAPAAEPPRGAAPRGAA